MTLIRRGILLEIQPWFREHSMAGQAVLPAVESLVLLAEAAREFCSETDTRQMLAGRFDRFLELADRESVELVVELEKIGDTVLAVLYSQKKINRFSRYLEHAQVHFATLETEVKEKKIRNRLTKDGSGFRVSGEQIYQDLIPFGSSYQNVITADLFPNGAFAQLQTPDIPLPPNASLPGSPFLLDAAFHAACVWGQRFAGFVPFPVGFKQRQIFLPSEPGQQYQGSIILTGRSKVELTFDLDILKPGGARVEQVQGLQMRNIRNGQLRPPLWLQL
jgi:hypothetical protein